MAGLYGHRWASAYGEDPRGLGGREWAVTLAGFTRAQVDAGLDACRNSGDDWPPSAPLFKARCLGIPALSTVRADLTRDPADRSPFTRMAWAMVDSHRYRQASAETADRMLRDAYELARERRMAGEALPDEPVAAIVDDSKRAPVPASPEVAEQRMAEIAEMLQPRHDPGQEDAA